MIILGLNSVQPVVKELKKKFTNLTAEETTELAVKIINAINKQLQEEE